jgi:hypothetical protein
VKNLKWANKKFNFKQMGHQNFHFSRPFHFIITNILSWPSFSLKRKWMQSCCFDGGREWERRRRESDVAEGSWMAWDGPGHLCVYVKLSSAF